MATQVKDNGERDFSIELKSKNFWRSVLSNHESGAVIIEGTLGKLQHASFVEPEILEIKGSHGVLRIYLRYSEITVENANKKYTGDVSE